MAKPVLRSGYTFTPASKQISFAGVPGFNINGLLAVFNRTAGVMIFDATEPTLDFASVSGSTVTLKYDTTSGMSSTDVLTIIYDEQAQDGLTTTLSLNANGAQPGIPTAGYGTVLVDAEGTFNFTITGQFSNNSTNGVDGTWKDANGWIPNNTSTASAPATTIQPGIPGRQYRATDGLWFRLVVSGYTSGTAVVTITRRVCGIAERAVTVSNAVSLSSGISLIGGTYGMAFGNVNPGTIPFRIKSTAGANTGLIFNSIANFCGGIISNSGTTAAFLKLYNKASAPVLSSDTPALTIMIPPGSTLNLDRTVARRFLTGLAYAITGGKADNDTTAVGADDIQGELIYA